MCHIGSRERRLKRPHASRAELMMRRRSGETDGSSRAEIVVGLVAVLTAILMFSSNYLSLLGAAEPSQPNNSHHLVFRIVPSAKEVARGKKILVRWELENQGDSAIYL